MLRLMPALRELSQRLTQCSQLSPHHSPQSVELSLRLMRR
jgi:hypothetical protein